MKRYTESVFDVCKVVFRSLLVTDGWMEGSVDDKTYIFRNMYQ